MGGTGSDVLVGGEGKDILNGVNNSAHRGTGSIDILTGGAGIDHFILSDSTGIFYNDNNDLSAGIEDFALITDFNASQDIIQLSGEASDYILESTSIGTRIYQDINGDEGLDNMDELIAIIEGKSGLHLSDSSFIYI